ncbi:MAG: TolC family protein [Bacteroidales bacterium]
MIRNITIMIALFTTIYNVSAESNNPLLDEYRKMALEYNHDLKSAQKSISASMELVKSAKDDLKPKIDGSANFGYTGNPMELSLEMPSLPTPLSFRGQEMQYGAALSLMQPLYTGGRVLASIKQAEQQQSLSSNRFDMVRSEVCFQTDVQYWSCVASVELLSIFNSSYESIKRLQEIVKDRVEVGIADPQDLLMVEVNLNNSHYQLLKSKNEATSNRMALNSLIGNDLDSDITIDQQISPSIDPTLISSGEIEERADIRMAYDNIEIQKSALKINDSKYKPQLLVGAEGSYSSPGYNFKSDLDPNYAIYAKISVPIFHWGKRRSDKRAYNYQVAIAQDNLEKVKDKSELEIENSKKNLNESVKIVEITSNSLDKAQENEQKSIERYNEGKVSIVEVIDAQLYRFNTEVNYVQAKLSMQISLAELQRALNAYNVE